MLLLTYCFTTFVFFAQFSDLAVEVVAYLIMIALQDNGEVIL